MWSLRILWFDELRQDLRYALRALRRTPGLVVVVVLTLGLGIGANTALFSVMDQLLLRMLRVDRPAELALLEGPGVYQGWTRNNQAFSVPMFRGLQAASEPVLSGMFARFSISATVSVANDAERASAELVSGEYFRTLGVGAALGRTLGPDDDRPGAHPAVVLSHAYWQRRFGGEARVLDQDIRVNGHPMTIVGVTALGFSGVDVGASADLFVPLVLKAELMPTWTELDTWRSRWVNVMGRLRPGLSRQQVAAALNVTYRQLLQDDVKTARLSSGERMQFLQKKLLVLPGGRGLSTFRNQFVTPLIALMAMVGLVLLIICANIASLMLARAATQQKEVAIRLALGARRSRVVRQRLTESVLLAAGGATVGLLLAWWTTSLLIDMPPFDRAARALSPDPDLRVVLFATGIAITTAVVFGLFPALHAMKPGLTAAFKQDTGNVVGGGSQAIFRKGLVVAQVALSVLLLTGTGMFARSLYNLHSLNPGFIADNLLQFSLQPATSGYTREGSLALFRVLQAELSALPGVTSASMASVPAMTDRNRTRTVRVQGYEPKQGEDMSPSLNEVGPGYFATMGIPLLMGREFGPTDDDDSPRVAVINETMARYFWGDENPVGRRFGWTSSETGDDIEVIGVVKDAKFTNIRDDVPRFFYTPYTQAESLDGIMVYVRHQPGIGGLSSAARQVVQRLDPSLPIFDLKTMEAQVDESLFVDRLVALLSILFGALATLLAAVGLYGVISYVVARRTREVGVRMALGAGRVSVLWMILREAIVLAAAGIVLGLPMALGLGWLVASQLFGVSPIDPLSLGAAAITLSAVALLAGYLPGWRATRVNPMLALRHE